MDGHQRIVRVRRDYNRWVANQTLEDYALRFTAKAARRWSAFRVANTAIGGISFLALEAIGGTITLTFGFHNAVAAILTVSVIIFLAGLPICYYAARHGVDIDLLTRGAGFGYLGSTITSLIYATFTFIFFAIEATILAKSLELGLGLPEEAGLILSALVVIPLVTYGFTFISRFQLWTQPIWIALQILPFVMIAIFDTGTFSAWTTYTGRLGGLDHAFDLKLFGAASGVVFSLIAQIAEQVDYLRFLPPRKGRRDWKWWSALITTGPGWIILGALKMLAGSFLAYLAFKAGVPPTEAAEPTHMYWVAFGFLTQDTRWALVIATAFVAISQLKINVTNSYAGSIAWSNFFSRLTHSHPGRVVWVVFNVVIALILMEFGIYGTLEHTLGLYAQVAIAWVGSIVADLVINKPLGLSPAGIEFKRAHLYDINPVGFGGMLASSAIGIAAHLGLFGATAAALSCFIGLGTALIAVPAIAALWGRRFYLAREAVPWGGRRILTCCICEHTFETEDMSHCPAFGGPICSLCCTLDSRCQDACKTGSRLSEQILSSLDLILPKSWLVRLNSSLGHYLGLLLVVAATISLVLGIVHADTLREAGPPDQLLKSAQIKTFVVLLLISGVVCWLFVLAHQSRTVAQEESRRQTGLLMAEIEAHERTDRELQKAKEVAEAANLAKSRYLVGISHEFRTPLNTILGYAQLIDRDALPASAKANAVRTIRRSGEHLAGLVEGLLDISKIEAGHLQLQRDVFRLPEFLEQIVDMFRLQAETNGIGFEFVARDRIPAQVRTDEKRLRQILINLLSNAIKFTPKGGVKIIFTFRADVGQFIIEDTGIGIAEEDLARIFVPFERIENPSGPWIPGTGLGLTITKLMTEILGGELTVTSKPGVGSRFAVRLHLPEVSDMSLPAVQRRRIAGYHGPRLTVLVADDEASHRQLIADLLIPLGFGVFPAVDGPASLEQAAALKPDIILLDITMPRLNGWDVARALREDHLSSAAIVMMSADAAGEPIGPASRTDHDGYIVKPFDIDQLLDTIGTLMGLTWIHEGDPPIRHGALSAIEPVAETPLGVGSALSKHDIEELKGLAEIGYIRAINDKLDHLTRKTASPEAAGLLALLRRQVADLDLEAMSATLETSTHEHR